MMQAITLANVSLLPIWPLEKKALNKSWQKFLNVNMTTFILKNML